MKYRIDIPFWLTIAFIIICLFGIIDVPWYVSVLPFIVLFIYRLIQVIRLNKKIADEIERFGRYDWMGNWNDWFITLQAKEL